MTDFPPPEKLLPHRGNMLLVHQLECVDLESMRSSALAQLGEDCLFYDSAKGCLPTEISIEIMAQGVGLLTCYRDYLQGTPPVESAMLLSVKKYAVYCEAIPANTLLRTTNEIAMEDGPIGVYNCELYRAEDSTLLAQAELTAYKP